MTREPVLRTLSIVLLTSLMAFAAPTAAAAQGFVSPLIGYDFSGDSLCPSLEECEEKSLNVGVAIGAMGNVVGFEQEFAYARDFFGDAPGLSSSVLTAMSNLMIVPNLGPFRPYVLAGLGLIKTRVELTPSSILDADNNHFGWDIGGGLMIFFGDHVGIRGDLRYYHSFEDLELLGFTLSGEKLDYGRVAGAVVFKF